MSWHHIVMNHSSTADGGCVQQPAHRRDPQQWGHSVVASLHHRQWQHVSVLDSLHSAPHQPIQLWQFAFLTEVLSGFAVSTKQRLAKVTKQCLIMFYKSYKYEFQECKWMIYIYIYKKTDSRRTKCGTQALNCPEVWQWNELSYN